MDKPDPVDEVLEAYRAILMAARSRPKKREEPPLRIVRVDLSQVCRDFIEAVTKKKA